MIRISASATLLSVCVAATAGAETPLPAPVSDRDYISIDPGEAALGQLLFYDPILSGNRNISCATCHHPRFATSDGLSLGLGEGGVGLGPERHVTDENRPEQRIPRNATALFNLGAHEFTTLFHDGRIEADPKRPSGIRTPMAEEMVTGFSGVLSAQTMFPVLSPDEMAGHYSENDVAKAVRSGRITGAGGAWDVISRRVAGVEDYAARFADVYPQIDEPDDIGFTDISNAIAAFVAFEWRSDSSPFDAALRGTAPLVGMAAEGASLFYGEAGCASCHSGPFQTDHDFHAMAAPQIGPGKAERFERHARDDGRMRVTGREEDRFAFRTPSLRNVTRTGPWGHAGAHDDLATFLADHASRADGLTRYSRAVVLPDLPDTKPDWAILTSDDEVAAIAAAAGPGILLSTDEIAALMAFLETLTDPAAISGRLGVPEAVPSGLPVDR
ncbi:cytochrome c peroxidase [Maritimibacter sp. UBA3975]|uniref:cytochrome-c peroxidase n=1 Tax=Maritimibacter sp. UBA3975 TaxID=1946833 RepID=UPI000C0951F5|nr:cytochrome c peroxidase [Maritimibacter sp. UBA3975]MAM61564.1 cytochrome-c peroxidase [Maritimibacter sp.]|tara:strand:+ start:1070 stop:2398 length:1329 start_codon:yes stop_codon:yes gene_type:complete